MLKFVVCRMPQRLCRKTTRQKSFQLEPQNIQEDTGSKKYSARCKLHAIQLPAARITTIINVTKIKGNFHNRLFSAVVGI